MALKVNQYASASTMPLTPPRSDDQHLPEPTLTLLSLHA